MVSHDHTLSFDVSLDSGEDAGRSATETESASGIQRCTSSENTACSCMKASTTSSTSISTTANSCASITLQQLKRSIAKQIAFEKNRKRPRAWQLVDVFVDEKSELGQRALKQNAGGDSGLGWLQLVDPELSIDSAMLAQSGFAGRGGDGGGAEGATSDCSSSEEEEEHQKEDLFEQTRTATGFSRRLHDSVDLETDSNFSADNYSDYTYESDDEGGPVLPHSTDRGLSNNKSSPASGAALRRHKNYDVERGDPARVVSPPDYAIKYSERFYEPFQTRKDLNEAVEALYRVTRPDYGYHLHRKTNRIDASLRGLTQEEWQERLALLEERHGPYCAWDVSEVGDLSRLFQGFQGFHADVSGWCTTNVTSLNSCFSWCRLFNCDISDWDVSSVTDMSNTFGWCFKFNQNLDGWDVSSVLTMDGMFSQCEAYNQPMLSWDVSKVEDMSDLFCGCTRFNQDLSTWDTARVKNMSCMLLRCPAFKYDEPVTCGYNSSEDEEEDSY
ncbi:unnamed protein product [Amoebophrya sp. A120]|nr:unnamed protein product [Amoebophrya sp. A120]|eukprot:GSA120T00008072001.1